MTAFDVLILHNDKDIVKKYSHDVLDVCGKVTPILKVGIKSLDDLRGEKISISCRKIVCFVSIDNKGQLDNLGKWMKSSLCSDKKDDPSKVLVVHEMEASEEAQQNNSASLENKFMFIRATSLHGVFQWCPRVFAFMYTMPYQLSLDVRVGVWNENENTELCEDISKMLAEAKPANHRHQNIITFFDENDESSQKNLRAIKISGDCEIVFFITKEQGIPSKLKKIATQTFTRTHYVFGIMYIFTVTRNGWKLQIARDDVPSPPLGPVEIKLNETVSWKTVGVNKNVRYSLQKKEKGCTWVEVDGNINPDKGLHKLTNSDYAKAMDGYISLRLVSEDENGRLSEPLNLKQTRRTQSAVGKILAVFSCIIFFCCPVIIVYILWSESKK